jgi:hypothetical protein
MRAFWQSHSAAEQSFATHDATPYARAMESEIVRHLVARHRPAAIVLVGSRADGAAPPGVTGISTCCCPREAEAPME